MMQSRYLSELLRAVCRNPREVELPEALRREYRQMIARGREEDVQQAIEATMGLSAQDASHVVMFQVRQVEVGGREPAGGAA